MSAHLKPEAGKTYRTHSGRVIHIVLIEGFRVWYRVESDTDAEESHWADFVTVASAIAEEVTP